MSGIASKIPGICWDKTNRRWSVRVTTMQGKRVTVGRFKEYKQAEDALATAQSEYFRCGCVVRSAVGEKELRSNMKNKIEQRAFGEYADAAHSFEIPDSCPAEIRARIIKAREQRTAGRTTSKPDNWSEDAGRRLKLAEVSL
jgi:AP2 domain